MNLIILGPAGSGKGTQAELLIKKLGLVHVDIGLALRHVAEEKSLLGRKVNKIINVKRELVPDKVIRQVLEKTLKKIPKNKGVILDGAPRRVGQIDEVENAFKKFGRKLKKVIFISLPSKVAIQRISKRYQCSQCEARLIMGKQIKSAKSFCPVCGGKISRRKDDTPFGIRKRFAVFREETLPVIRYYREKGMLYEADGRKGSDTIAREMVKMLK